MRASLAALLLILVAGPALADHVYTHRYVVSGRVVDPDGVPIPAILVELQVDAATSLTGDCRPRPPEVRHDILNITDGNRTNSFGDFEACAHAHALGPRSTARIRVADGPWRNLTVDRGTRITFASFTVERPDDAPAPDPAWNRTLLVRARVWRPSEVPLELDGIPAQGEALPDRTVYTNVTGIAGRGKTGTDRYGDMAYYKPLGAEAEGNVTFRTEDAPDEVALFHGGQLRAEAVLFVKASRFATGQPSPTDEPDGRSLVPTAGGGVLAVLAVGAALALARKR